MKKLLTILMVIISLPVLAQQKQVFTAHDLFRVNQVAEVAISPDAEYVAYTIIHPRPFKEGAGSDYRELHILDLESGESRAFLTGKKTVYDLQWRPDGNVLSFRGNIGDKSGQVYGIKIHGGSYYAITDVPYSIREYEWHPEGKVIAFSAEEKPSNPNDQLRNLGFKAEVFEEAIEHINLYIYDVVSGSHTRITQDITINGFDWHPSGEKLAAQVAPNNLVDDSYMFKKIKIIYPESGKVQDLIDNPGKLTSMSWSPDGEHLAFVSAVDINDPVAGSLFIVEEENKKAFTELRNYTLDFEGSVVHVGWKDDETVVFSSEESLDATLREVEIDDDETELILKGGQVVLRNFSIAKEIIAFGGHTSQHPSELFTFDLDDEKLTRHTTLNNWLSGINFGKQELISYEARDGLRIDGTLIYPVDYQEGKRYPLITYVHGGPEASVANGWVTRYSMWGQIAAGKGYFVFMPNYRASSGRGVEFSKMDQKDLAAAEFDDVLDGIEYLIEDGKVARNKVGIGGGSYGGYFSAWAATKHSEHFAAAVAFVGISNQISKRNTTDIPYEDYHVHWNIWTYEDPELIYDRSPVKWVRNNETPTLILHGKEDPRVHPSQSLELYRQLKMHGNAPVRLIWYPGEGHGNRMNPNRLDYALRTMNWFDYYLKDQGPQDELPEKDLDYELDLN